jgi:hypothetical protein
LLSDRFWTVTWRLFVLVLILLSVVFVGLMVYRSERIDGLKLDNGEYMRGLFTFLFLVGGLVLVLILILAALFADNDDSTRKRVSQAREILTPVFGILGTIVGFYFGSHGREAPKADKLGVMLVRQADAVEKLKGRPEGMAMGNGGGD